MNTLTSKAISQTAPNGDTPLSHEILVLFYGAQDFDLQRYQKSNQALDKWLKSFDAGDYLRSKSPLIINDILAIKLLTDKDKKRKYYSQILKLIEEQPSQAINLPILLIPKEEITEYKDIFEEILYTLIKNRTRASHYTTQKIFSYLPDSSKKKAATCFYQCFARGKTTLGALFITFYAHLNAIELSKCLDIIIAGLGGESYDQGFLDSTSDLPDVLKKRLGVETVMNIIRNKLKYALCLGSLFQVLSEEDKQRVITEIQKTHYANSDDIKSFIYAINSLPSDYHLLLEGKIREVIDIACKHTSGYASDKTRILSLQLIPLLPIKSQVEICNTYASPIGGTIHYSIHNYDICVFLLHASDEVYNSHAFDALRDVIVKYSYEEFKKRMSTNSLSNMSDYKFTQAMEKLFKRLGRSAEIDPSKNENLAINKLSQHIDKKEQAQTSEKQGQNLSYYQESLKENVW